MVPPISPASPYTPFYPEKQGSFLVFSGENNDGSRTPATSKKNRLAKRIRGITYKAGLEICGIANRLGG